MLNFLGNDHNKIALLHPNTPNVSVEGLIAADKLGEQKCKLNLEAYLG